MTNPFIFLPRFAAVSTVLLAACAAASAPSHAQEGTPPPAPPVPAVPAAPAAPADAKGKTDAEKKRFADALKVYNEARKAYTDADRKRIDEMVQALKANNMAVRAYGYAAPGFMNAVRLPSQVISLNLKSVSTRDALVKVLNEAKLDYVLDDDFPAAAKLSLFVSGVQVSTALDLVTQSAGVRWAAEKRDGKIIVRAGKNVAANVFSLAYASPNALSNLFGAGTPGTPGTPAPFLRWNGVQLPPTKISINVTDASTRDTLITLLEKQKLAYEIADDFPKEAKISLAIENADLSSVLDSITRSVGCRWVVDKRGDKLVVRVGKNVVPDSFYYLYGGKDGKSGSVLPVPAEGQRVNMIRVDKSASGTPIIYQYQTSEERSTFTCPKCGKKMTIVQKNAKSSDGAKTDNHDDWHFCPFCGKKVSAQNGNLAAPLWKTETGDAMPETGATGFVTLPLLPSLSVYDTSFSDNAGFIAPAANP